MSKEVTPEDWVAALKSGKYKKARSMLRNPRTGGMCCIGVLHDLCGTLSWDKMNGEKSFIKELLPEWTGSIDLPEIDGGDRAKNLHRLAELNDSNGGYPIAKIEELFLQS